MKTQEEVLSLLAEGLEAAAKEQAVSMLGNRQTYLGMSDLARGLSCPRAIAADKLKAENTGLSLDKLLPLRRGHWLEHGLEEALSALKIKFIPQLEISIQHQGTPIKAHLDLTLPDESSRSVTVLELKSVGRLRDQVYGSHEAQLYGQLSLLARFWNRRVFSSGRQYEEDQTQASRPEACSFPELVSRQLGLKFAEKAEAVSIRGFVVVVSPKSARTFGPYEPNDIVLSRLLETGTELWRQITEIRSGRMTLDGLACQKGFSPLCGWCGHNRDCPKFDGQNQLELEPELASLAEMKKRRSDIDDEIKEREQQLKSIAALMRLTDRWISSANYRFKVNSQTGRISFSPANSGISLHPQTTPMIQPD
jgi:hypothetical protein